MHTEIRTYTTTSSTFAYCPLEMRLLQRPTYDPDALLDHLIERYQIKNDAGLARKLEVTPALISKVRHRKLAVSEALMIRIHKVFNLSIGEIENLMGGGSMSQVDAHNAAAKVSSEEVSNLRKTISNQAQTINIISAALSDIERQLSKCNSRMQTAENELRRLRTPPDIEEEMRNFEAEFEVIDTTPHPEPADILRYEDPLTQDMFAGWMARAKRGNA